MKKPSSNSYHLLNGVTVYQWSGVERRGVEWSGEERSGVECLQKTATMSTLPIKEEARKCK